MNLWRIVLIPPARQIAVFAMLLCWSGQFANGADSAGPTTAHRRLADVMNECRARREPVDPQDFRPRPVPDEQNAAYHLNRAFKAIRWTPEQQRTFNRSLSFTLPLTDQDRALMHDLVAANTAVFDELTAARTLRAVDWGYDFKRPVYKTMVFQFTNDQHLLGDLTYNAALYAHDAGDDASAIERLIDLFTIGRALDEMPSIVTHTVAEGRQWQVSYAIELTSWDLNIRDDRRPNTAPATLPGGDRAPASRRQVATLLALLLDEQPDRDRFVRTWWGERMMALDAVGELRRMPLAPAQFEEDAVTLADYLTSVAEAAKEPNWPAASAKVREQPDTGEVKDDPSKSAHPVFMLAAAGKHVLLHSFRTTAGRRMAALALAIRIYRIDHERFPATLEQLVPDYLPSLPLDPFFAKPRSFGYLPDAARPMLYSVGENGVDDGGSTEARTEQIRRYADRIHRRIPPDDMNDQPFYLAPEPSPRN